MYLGGGLINKTEQQKIKYPGKKTKPLPHFRSPGMRYCKVMMQLIPILTVNKP